jgi:hypothetical protein
LWAALEQKSMSTHERRFRGIARSATALVCLASGLAASPVRAELPGAASIPAGTVIDSKNVSSFGDLGGPGLRWIVERGARLEVGAYRKVANPPPFLEATQKYSSSVKLSEDGKGLTDYVAGLPFPQIDPNDPHVAIKLVLNFEAAVARDDLDLRNFECRTRTFGADATGDLVLLADHFRRLYFRGRTVVPPVPEITENRDKVRYKEILFPLIEPFDSKGNGFLTLRYLDRTRNDDTWLYLPQLRRVRRLSAVQRSVPLQKQDIDMDSYAGFSGNPAWFSWRSLGEKTILSTFHDATIPVTWGEPPGDFVHAGTWEPRKVWVVEGIPQVPVPTDLGEPYAYSRRVLYIDQETSRIPYSDLYDRAGQLSKVSLTSFLFAKAPTATATARFDYDVPFEPSMTMVDVQRPGATFCELPSRRFPDEQGWYVNVGDKEGTTESAFEMMALIVPGR